MELVNGEDEDVDEWYFFKWFKMELQGQKVEI